MKKIFPVLLLTLFCFSCKQTAEKFYNAGIKKMHTLPESSNGKPSQAAVEAQLRAAINDFSEAIKLDSNCLKAYENRLSIRQALDDYAGSLADAEKLATLEPKSASVHYAVGRSKDDLKDYAGAIVAFGKAIALDPKNAEYYSARAHSEESLDEDDAALKDYDQSIIISPSGRYSRFVYYARGVLKHTMNDNSGCLIDLQKAKSLGDQNTQADVVCK